VFYNTVFFPTFIATSFRLKTIFKILASAGQCWVFHTQHVEGAICKVQFLARAHPWNIRKILSWR